MINSIFKQDEVAKVLEMVCNLVSPGVKSEVRVIMSQSPVFSYWTIYCYRVAGRFIYFLCFYSARVSFQHLAPS